MGAKERNQAAREIANHNPEAVTDALAATVPHGWGVSEGVKLRKNSILRAILDAADPIGGAPLLAHVIADLVVRSQISDHSRLTGWRSHAKVICAGLSKLCDPDSPDPLSLLTRVVESMPRMPETSSVTAVQGMTRRAAIISDTRRVPWTDNYALDAAIVDGEPMMAELPDLVELFPEPRRRKRRLFKAGEGLPLKVDGMESPPRDLRLTALEGLPPILAGDVLTLGTIAHTLDHPMRIHERDGAALLARTRDGGFRRPKQTDIKRFWQAAAELRASLIYDPHGSGRWAEWAKVEGLPNKRGVIMGRPEWMNYRNGGLRYTLTAEGGRAGKARVQAGESGAAGRLITGIEYRLAARFDGRSGTAPDLRPATKGGPGPMVLLSWRDAMGLMAESWDRADPKADHAARKRWSRMVNSLLKAGYKIATFRGEAETGDSVEIVDVMRGSRAGSAGLRVRASARFVEAARLSCLKDGKGFETVRLTDWLPEGVRLTPARK